MSAVAYDAGALIAAERGSRRLWALHRRALERGVRPTVTTPALAQAWRGARQVQLARLVSGCRVVPFGERDARRTGAALALSGTVDVVDACVVVAAAARGALVVTSDPSDLRTIADALGARTRLHVV